MPEEENKIETEKIKSKPHIFAGKERRRRHEDFQQAVSTFESFVDEVGKYPYEKEKDDKCKWKKVRKYDRPGTYFEWWDDPLAEGSIIELRSFGNFGRDEPIIVGSPILFTVGKTKKDQKYPTLYRYDLQDYYNTTDTVRNQITNTTRIITHSDEKDENEAAIKPTIENNKSRLEVHIWLQGSTKKEKKNKPKHSSKRISRPQMEPVPVPIPVK